jgi:hypothetical protein
VPFVSDTFSAPDDGGLQIVPDTSLDNLLTLKVDARCEDALAFLPADTPVASIT